MTRKIYTLLLVFLIALTTLSSTAVYAERAAKASPAASHELLNSLPSSDFILYVDAQRVMTEIIPSLIITSPEERTRFEADLARFQKDTGLDPRLLDTVVVGMNLEASGRMYDHDFAVIARGRFDAQSTLETGLENAVKKGSGLFERRTEQYEGRTIYILGRGKSQVTLSAPQRPQVVVSGTSTTVTTVVGPEPVACGQDKAPAPPRETGHAFVALDSNTIVFGSPKSVRATIDASLGRGRVSDALVELATRTPGAAVSFSGNLTPETAKTFGLITSSKIADSLSSIKQVYGAFNLNGTDAEAFINLRTLEAENARQLSMMLNGLKFMARIGHSSGNMNTGKTIEALINGVTVDAVGDEVQITMRVTQADLAPIVRKF
jgi:hypothetical protein